MAPSLINIFVSYSHRDVTHVKDDGLVGFIKGLERDMPVRFWVDCSLVGGDKWDNKIKSELEACNVAILLLSQTYLDSFYCMEVEVQNFLRRCGQDGMRIYPIVLSACEWDQHAWLNQYQMLPGNNETIEDYCDVGTEKKVFLRIRKELRSIIEQLMEEQSQKNIQTVKKTEINAELRTVTLLQISLSVDSEKYGLDQEDSLEFLYEAAPMFKERCISEVELLNGYIVNMSVSGKILICFGYPDSQELDSVKAVRAGLAVLKACKKLNEQLLKDWKAELTIRNGIHTGMVIGKTGADTQEQLEYGQASKIAECIMKAASPNSLLIGEQTYRLVKGFFETAQQVDIFDQEQGKNIHVWKVGSDLGLNTRFEASEFKNKIPIIGRRHEVNLILEKWERAHSGKGQFILVSSDAGLGKSRLIEEIEKQIAQSQRKIVELQCTMFTTNSTFYPIVQSLKKLLHIDDSDNDEIKLRKIADYVASGNLQEQEVVPFIAEVLQISHNYITSIGGLTPKQLKDRIIEAVLLLLLSLTEKGPLLISIEDLHWIDSSTLECLNVLIHEVAESRICILASCRPEFTIPSEWQSLDYFSLVKLMQLERDMVSELVHKITGGKIVPDEMLDAIYRKTEGYPLFVEELTQMVTDSGMLTEKNGQFELTGPIEELSIPDTLHESLMARLNKLEGGRVIGQIGAVIGREFSFDLIKEVAPLDSDALKSVLDQLVNSGLVHKRGLLSKKVFIFKHALIQDALYDSMLKKERKRYHKRIINVLKDKFTQTVTEHPELLMYHCKEADEHEEAVTYGIAACEQSAHESANVEVLNLARNSLKILGNLPESPARNKIEKKILIMRGPALLAIKGWSSPEIGENFKRAKQLSSFEENPNEMFTINRGLWGYLMVSAQLSESIKISDELLQLGEKENSDDLRLEAYVAYCDSYFWMGKTRDCLEYAEKGLGIYDFERHHTSHSLIYGEDPSSVLFCYSTLCLWLLGETEKAEKRYEHVQKIVDQYTHQFSKAFLYNGLAWYCMLTNRPAEALKWGGIIKEIAKCHDFFQWLAVGKTQAGWGKACIQDINEGIAEMRSGITMWREAGGVVTIGFALSMMVDACMRHGKYEEALIYVEEALEFYNSCEQRYFLSQVLRQKAELVIKIEGDQTASEKLLHQSLTIAHEQDLKAFIDNWKA